MTNGVIVAICIAQEAGGPMLELLEVEAIAAQGLSGDRYARGAGSFNKGTPGKRQVTLINALFVDHSGFSYLETRRNIAVRGIELMDHIGHEFRVGDAVFRGLKYCETSARPSKLSGNPKIFREAFWDRGGLVAEILTSGLIRVGGDVVPRKKDY